MTTVRLTDARIKALKPTTAARDFHDSDLQGFGFPLCASIKDMMSALIPTTER